jgi:hypothetical protein
LARLKWQENADPAGTFPHRADNEVFLAVTLRMTPLFALATVTLSPRRRPQCPMVFCLRPCSVTLRGVLLLLATICSALASSAVAAPAGQVVPGSHQAPPRVTASPFGIPFPASRDPREWQAWRQRERAQLKAARGTPGRANADGTSSSGIIETIAGAVPFQKPVNALKTGLGQIQSIAEDSKGNLYVGSCDMRVVLKVDSSSNVTVYAGQPLPTGPAASSGDGGPATSARISCPLGLVVDASGNLYISDDSEGTVREVDAATGLIHTIASAAEAENPDGLALDGAGNLFMADFNFVRDVNLKRVLSKRLQAPRLRACSVFFL